MVVGNFPQRGMGHQKSAQDFAGKYEKRGGHHAASTQSGPPRLR